MWATFSLKNTKRSRTLFFHIMNKLTSFWYWINDDNDDDDDDLILVLVLYVPIKLWVASVSTIFNLGDNDDVPANNFDYIDDDVIW